MITFLKRLRLRVIWSWAGVVLAWKEEHSFRSWVWANLVSGGLAFWLPLETAERALILALGVLVLAAELFNTAIERAVDYISEEPHPLAGQAKDAGSAAVAVTAVAAGVAWVVVLWGMVCELIAQF
ncbi:diacylglycerol kinase [Shimia thalassica]|uniref:diacylglycerol kinase n=2 Tax=Shimia thalassica TaxID=1715693 RepID=UPI002735FBB6|nr:diacylglycerol kinase [Shimia thalassica]MDP2519275.1 diacylglycerol kinase [Shimia thalassica]